MSPYFSVSKTFSRAGRGQLDHHGDGGRRGDSGKLPVPVTVRVTVTVTVPRSPGNVAVIQKRLRRTKRRAGGHGPGACPDGTNSPLQVATSRNSCSLAMPDLRVSGFQVPMCQGLTGLIWSLRSAPNSSRPLESISHPSITETRASESCYASARTHDDSPRPQLQVCQN